MLPVRAWRVLYADGSEFTSDDGTWAEAPPFGVFAVVYYHLPEGVTTDRDQDIYWHIDREAGGQEWKMGLWVDNGTYLRLHDLVEGMVTP